MPCPSNLPQYCFFLSPSPPPSLLGPWIMSTGELENRMLVCFASLAPSRQHQLPAAEEGAARGLPASLPTLVRLIREAFLRCLASPPPDPLVPGVHLPMRAWVRVQGGRKGTTPTPSDPVCPQVAVGTRPGSLTCGQQPTALPFC